MTENTYSIFPALNATLNGTSAVLILIGRKLIAEGKIAAHRAVMITAVVTSSLFLASYLYYHAHVGSVRFQGQGWSRPVYFSILISHTILAAATLPLVIITLSRALRQRFDRHRAIARWTFPIWLYVSVTGVVIYFMLYHLFAHV
jgi:putative membrane protein